MDLTRRSVVRAGVWSAPAITLATAVPAHAAVSGVPTMTVAWNTDSFRGGDSTASPSAGFIFYLGINVIVAGGSLSRVVVNYPGSLNTITRYAATIVRGATSWTSNTGYSAWAITGGTPPPFDDEERNPDSAAGWTFTRTGTLTSASLAFASYPQSSPISPRTLDVTGYYSPVGGGPETALPTRTVTVTTTTTTPFLTGSVS